MKKLICCLTFFCALFQLSAQKECWVLFKYKGSSNVTTTLIDSTSLPLNSFFLRSLEKEGVCVLNKSKWLNAVYVKASEQQIETIKKLSYVEEIIFPSKIKISTCTASPVRHDMKEEEILRKQISLMGGEKFIKEKLTGKGVKIGVLDVGFSGYKKTKELDHLIKNNHIKETKSFSGEGLELGFQKNHGTEVLSCLAGKTDSSNIGLATEADYYLATYHRVPEMVEALEWFEENGVVIINNSTKIDFAYFDKEDLTGDKVLATKALASAAKKGMLIFSSMGNEGDNYWRSLVAPADAKGIISVASVSPETELHSAFSSFGPTFDRRIKPELTGVGETVVANQNKMTKENGTSFSTPLVAGFAACAWQLHPLLKKDSLYAHLIRSGNLYPYFDYAHGYGIPQADYFIRLKLPLDTARFIAPLEYEEKGDTLFFFAKNGTFEKKDSDEKEQIKWLNQNLGIIYKGQIMKREGNFRRKAIDEDLDGKNYVFYHIADETGFLKKYCVIKLENENIFFVTKSSMKPGYTLRVCFKGYTIEKKF